MMSPANPALQRMIQDVPVRVDVILGDLRISVDDLLALAPGDVVALEQRTTDPVEIHVAGRCFAKGRLMVADGKLGVTLTEILDIRD
ncbi:MAG: FliM/FliN family flagellar motor switch protein [Pseudomonadota bacterium]